MMAPSDTADVVSHPPPKTKIKTTRLVRAETNLSRQCFGPLNFFIQSHPLTTLSMLSLKEEKVWCYSCDAVTGHELRYMAQPDFTGKLLICKRCGETVKKPVVAGCEACS